MCYLFLILVWVGYCKDFDFYFEMRNYWKVLVEEWYDLVEILISLFWLLC